MPMIILLPFNYLIGHFKIKTKNKFYETKFVISYLPTFVRWR